MGRGPFFDGQCNGKGFALSILGFAKPYSDFFSRGYRFIILLTLFTFRRFVIVLSSFTRFDIFDAFLLLTTLGHYRYVLSCREKSK